MEIYKHFKMNSMLRYITVILFIVSATVKADLKPNYSDEQNKLKFFDARENDPLFLSCKPSNTDSAYTITWEKNGTDVKNVAALTGRYEIKENNLIIKNTLASDDGNYTCRNSANGESAEIQVIANAYVKKMADNMNVVEGEKLQIHCKVLGTDPEITWFIGNKSQSEFNASHVKLSAEDNVENAVLTIDHVELSDRNFYNCTAINRATGQSHKPGASAYTKAEDNTYVRVKGKLAALWPFLGICAEVFILCAIILVYEKRRNKEGLDESDTDQSPEQEKLKTGK